MNNKYLILSISAFILFSVYLFVNENSVPNLIAKELSNQKPKPLNKNILPKGRRPSQFSTTELYSFKTEYISISPNSTVIFEESFEGTTGFPPNGWRTFNQDGGGITGPWFQGNTSVFSAYSGSGYAAANYQGANDFYIDEWLISPRISNIGSNDTLAFWHRSPDYSSWDDSIEVRISTTDSALSSFTIRVDYFKTSTTGWVQKRYPLKNFISSASSIHIAFRYLLYDGGISGFSSDYVGIDLVQIIRPQVANDIKVVTITNPLSNSKILTGYTIFPTVTFQNAGTSAQTNIPVRLKIVNPSKDVFVSNKTINSLAPYQSLNITFDDYTPLYTGTYIVTAYALLPTDQNRFNDSLKINFLGSVPLSGTFTVGTGGNILTLRQAVDTLTSNIIAGEIIFSLINTTYNEPPLTIQELDYYFNDYNVIIKPAVGISPTINFNATINEQYGIAIKGASKIIIDGSNSNNYEQNLTINVIGTYGKIGIAIYGIEGSNADSNIIKNLKIRTAADSNSSAFNYYGILVSGYSSTYKCTGNKIQNCDITKHGATGIASFAQSGLVIENNTIHDWTQYGEGCDITGIFLGEGTTNTVVNGNIIGNLKNLVNYYWTAGIENYSGTGSNALIYNNFIYNIIASGEGSEVNFSRGIWGSNIANSGDSYYYNSIFLSGTDLSTSSQSRTAGIELVGGSNINVKNNIIYNTTVLSGSASDNKAYCIYLSVKPLNFSSNHNNFFVPNIQGCVGYNSGNKTTLIEWINSFTPAQDINSISTNPFFESPLTGNLHISPVSRSPVDGAAIPISGIISDIDGDIRDPSNPDIGADEFVSYNFILTTQYFNGWNLVSVPLQALDYRKTFLFPKASSEAFGYNGSTYYSSPTLANRIGYWLKFPFSQNITFGGDSIAIDTIEVVQGWNLIGSISYAVSTNNIIQIPNNIIVSPFYKYNSGYVAVSTILPGKGYWVKVNQDGKLILN